MSWYQPLLDEYQEHMIQAHGNLGEYDLHQEYYFMEEHLHYEKWRHGELEHINCCMVGCKWHKHFTINFDLLIREGEEE